MFALWLGIVALLLAAGIYAWRCDHPVHLTESYKGWIVVLILGPVLSSLAMMGIYTGIEKKYRIR